MNNMKKLLIILVTLLWCNFSYASDTAWKIGDKFIKPECLAYNTSNNLYLWESFDNYEEYYTKYIGIEDFDYWTDKNFKHFVNNIGLYLNKEIPLNHKFAPWNDELILSLTLDLTDCLSEKSVTRIERDDGWLYDAYTIEKNIDLKEAKKLAPNINQEVISIKSIKTNTNDAAIFGILNVDNKLIMVPLKILNTW
jgi:hypothetical protein